ncbi:MAG: hypothetical protein IIA61_13595 [Candidatus Marinimicrobia bacterium]|nr:hypothetical protein [Candidatus Neomarinimicrobiota bacterium]
MIKKIYHMKNQYNSGWEKKEIEILRKDYPKGGCLLVRKRLHNRTPNAVRSKCKRLGIKYDSNPWKDWEIAILKKWYPLVGYRTSKSREIIGTPNILKFLPNRSKRVMDPIVWTDFCES